jgi:hypothetical protein
VQEIVFARAPRTPSIIASRTRAPAVNRAAGGGDLNWVGRPPSWLELRNSQSGRHTASPHKRGRPEAANELVCLPLFERGDSVGGVLGGSENGRKARRRNRPEPLRWEVDFRWRGAVTRAALQKPDHAFSGRKRRGGCRKGRLMSRSFRLRCVARTPGTRLVLTRTVEQSRVLADRSSHARKSKP